MSIEKVEAFLEELKTNHKAAELLAGQKKSVDEDEKVKAYTKVAKKMGYDLTEENLIAYWKEQAAARKAKTDAQVETIKMLADDEVEGVTGGQQEAKNGDMCVDTHGSCDYSYLNKENCWSQDGCDFVLRHYDDYECKRNENYADCGTVHQADLNCSSAIF